MIERKAILLLEDDEFHRTLLAEGLEEYYDYHVHQAETIEEAEGVLHSVSPDLLILDCVMGENRFQVIEWARKIRKRQEFSRTPILFVTAFYREMEEQVKRIESASILEKPFTFEDVTEKMKELLGRRVGQVD